MQDETRRGHFGRGIVLFRQGRLTEASAVFSHLVNAVSTDPIHLSYHGLHTATVRGKPDAGRKICEHAVNLGAYEPQIFLNLVRLYETLGEVAKAVEVLRAGIRCHRGDQRLLREIQRLSPRRRPPLSMVHRDHFLNKHLAILLARMSKRISKQPAQAELRHRSGSRTLRRLQALRQT